MTLLIRVLTPAILLFCFVAELSADSDASRIPQLIKALGDRNVRYGAAIAFAQLGSEAVPALRKSLASDEPEPRVWAAYTLGEIGPAAKAAVGDLKKALGNKSDAALRAAAAQALGTIGPAAGKAAPALVATLKDQQVRADARTALIRLGKPAAAALQESLADDGVRFDAAAVLLRGDVEKARQSGVDKPTDADLPSLRIVLHDTTRSPPERAAAAKGLASLGPQGIGILIKAFEDETIATTATAAFASVDPAAVAPLIEALTHEQPDVRAAVANALGYIGPAAAGKSLPHLVKLLKDDDHDVRYCAVRALDMFNQNAAPAIPDLIELMHDSSQRELARQWAIMALVDMHPAAHDAIVKGLIKASQNKENYGVSSLARQQVRKIDLKAAEAAGVR